MGRSMHRAEEACKKATYAPHMGEAPLRGYAVIYIFHYRMPHRKHAMCRRSMQEGNTRPRMGKPHFGDMQ